MLVYDVPQTFHLHLAGHATARNISFGLFIGTEGYAEVAFTGGQLIDAEGNDVRCASFTLVEVPEPSIGVLTGFSLLDYVAQDVASRWGEDAPKSF